MIRIVHIAVVIGCLLHTAGGAADEAQDARNSPTDGTSVAELPAGPGRDAVIKGCAGVCHDASVLFQSYSADDWVSRVNEMIGLGAQVSDEDYVPVVMYLISNFSPDADAP